MSMIYVPVLVQRLRAARARRGARPPAYAGEPLLRMLAAELRDTIGDWLHRRRR
jgi:hypothetical protein